MTRRDGEERFRFNIIFRVDGPVLSLICTRVLPSNGRSRALIHHDQVEEVVIVSLHFSLPDSNRISGVGDTHIAKCKCA